MLLKAGILSRKRPTQIPAAERTDVRRCAQTVDTMSIGWNHGAPPKINSQSRLLRLADGFREHRDCNTLLHISALVLTNSSDSHPPGLPRIPRSCLAPGVCARTLNVHVAQHGRPKSQTKIFNIYEWPKKGEERCASNLVLKHCPGSRLKSTLDRAAGSSLAEFTPAPSASMLLASTVFRFRIPSSVLPLSS